jgi:hypothetical protein
VSKFNNKMCSGHDIAEILLKLALNTNQSINQSINNETLLTFLFIKCFHVLVQVISSSKEGYHFHLDFHRKTT